MSHDNKPHDNESGGEPNATAGTWQSLPERVRRVWWMNAAIQSACWLIGDAIGALVLQSTGWWAGWPQALRIGVMALIAAIAVLNPAVQPLQTRYEFAFDRFLIGEHDIRIRTGWLFHQTVTVPYNRVQHVQTKQGPVMRHCNLVTLEIHTASDEHQIEALDPAEAQRVNDLIAKRVLASKEDL
ncbi:PH domain-containing protein [Bifidobacterium oedipodis]|uniref:Bacterial PH domain-containing protein n=1 Tax=Bifidobacterium oedipodis TaxID=2675322 RepID=A0A7Y0HSY5_9BIFI|nr:PH domain-containing protein [Bifidobacterium sp. DSM 109957]NMM93542.1 Bacterial PH domain-containing protein [Bifidobacterium sp. DSM 109957]